MDESHMIDSNLKKAKLSRSDVMSKLRENNVSQLSDVKAVVMETTGSISVIHNTSEKEVDEVLLEHVKK